MSIDAPQAGNVADFGDITSTGPIETNLSKLQKTMSSMVSMLRALEGHLTPVLSPREIRQSLPEPSAGGGSPIATELQKLNAIGNEAHATLSQLIERIEL